MRVFYKFMIVMVLALAASTVICAQEKQLVVYRTDGQQIRIDIADIDSMTLEPAQYDRHTAVDLGLSVMWADCNLGAVAPEDFGDYFAWGETESKETYNEDNYCPGGEPSATSQNIGKDISRTQYDAAHVLWGFNWRMPTIAEVDELTSQCTWTWTSEQGVSGYRVTGPSGQSIFLPAAGQMRGAEVMGAGSQGYYWSATLSDEYATAAFNLNFTGYTGHWSANRSYGFAVRAVRK